MASNGYIEGPVADLHIVKALTDHLARAYEAFLNDYPGNVDYIDAFMGAHNFHKVAVGHLVHETGELIWWQMAVSTFETAVRVELGKREGGGGNGRSESENHQE